MKAGIAKTARYTKKIIAKVYSSEKYFMNKRKERRELKD